MDRCQHARLCFQTSPYAEEAEFKALPEAKLEAAARMGARKDSDESEDHKAMTKVGTFPAPLVLPEDAIALDPEEPGQSLRSWHREKHRNKVTDQRRVLYVVGSPGASPEIKHSVESWAKPCNHYNGSNPSFPDVEEVVEYLSAFYHGMEVRVFPKKPHFSRWEGEPAQKATKRTQAMQRGEPNAVGLSTSAEMIQIRNRAPKDGQFPRQLNLNDLLDWAIESLPNDAYALLMLVNHDLYEDQENDLACGRAYGGSRVYVVSTARYNPILDDSADVDRQHAWPASHCDDFLRRASYADDEPVSKNRTVGDQTPLHAALAAFRQCSEPNQATTWLERVCRTASHELGHCFGIAHCMYHACMMQSTASVAEDIRQPPYLCPIDLIKVLHATGADVLVRYRTLLAFCEQRPNGAMFSAFAGWLKARLHHVESQEHISRTSTQADQDGSLIVID